VAYGDTLVPDFLSDAQIAALLAEPKLLSEDFRARLAGKAKRGHQEAELDVQGTAGSEFRIIMRRSSSNPLDFSVILAYRVPNSSTVIRLRRYNGKSHSHSNPLERQGFYDFHIHTATERYQVTGNREDTFAEATTRYASIDEALDCLLEDCAFVFPPEHQPDMFRL